MKKRPSWEEIFMFQAISCATRHTCLKRGVGAVVVKNKKIIGSGYNGAACGLKSCHEFGYCYYENLAQKEAKQNGGKISEIKESFKIYCRAVHAEANALSQCTAESAQGSSLYITNYPCTRCAQDQIITHGIKTVKIWKDYLENPLLTIDEKRASEHKLLEAGISLSYQELSKKRIIEIANYMTNQVGERTNYKYSKPK